MEIQPASVVVTPPEGAQLAALDRHRPLEVRLGNIVRAIAERAFSWLNRCRRLAKDYERLPTTLAGLHFVALACLMVHKAVPLLASGP